MQFSSECDFIAVNEFSLGFVNAFHGLTWRYIFHTEMSNIPKPCTHYFWVYPILEVMVAAEEGYIYFSIILIFVSDATVL
jgi:hypothetical protein